MGNSNAGPKGFYIFALDGEKRPVREFDAGDASTFLREKIERHAEQERKQHDRSAVMLGQEGGRDGDDHAHQDARQIASRHRPGAGTAADQSGLVLCEVVHRKT